MTGQIHVQLYEYLFLGKIGIVLIGMEAGCKCEDWYSSVPSRNKTWSSGLYVVYAVIVSYPGFINGHEWKTKHLFSIGV
jgi:hypothetical protein